MCFGFFSATFLDNFNRYVDDKYKTDIRKLTRNRKASFKDYYAVSIVSKWFYGFSGGCEIIFKKLLVRRIISISQQDIGKQRGYLSPILYKGLCLRIIITEFLQKF